MARQRPLELHKVDEEIRAICQEGERNVAMPPHPGRLTGPFPSFGMGSWLCDAPVS